MKKDSTIQIQLHFFTIRHPRFSNQSSNGMAEWWSLSQVDFSQLDDAGQRRLYYGRGLGLTAFQPTCFPLAIWIGAGSSFFDFILWFSDSAFFRHDDKLRMTGIAFYKLFTLLPYCCWDFAFKAMAIAWSYWSAATPTPFDFWFYSLGMGQRRHIDCHILSNCAFCWGGCCSAALLWAWTNL